MPDCEVVRSSTMKLDPRLVWKLNLNFNGFQPFSPVELEDKTVVRAEVSRCKNYGTYEDAIVVVFELKPRD